MSELENFSINPLLWQSSMVVKTSNRLLHLAILAILGGSDSPTYTIILSFSEFLSSPHGTSNIKSNLSHTEVIFS